MRKATIIGFFALLALPSVFYALSSWAAPSTTVHNVRIGRHGEFTRLVFDSFGDRPQRIGPPSSRSVTLQYGVLKLLARPGRLVTSPVGAVSSITHDSSRITVHFTDAGARVKSFYLAASPPAKGFYRLVLDVYPSSSRTSESRPAREVRRESTPPPPRKPKDSSPPSIPSPEKPDTGQASEAEEPLEPLPAPVERPSSPENEKEETSEDNPFAQAHRLFHQYRDDLESHAHKIAQEYERLLKIHSRGDAVPLALYRLGQACLALGRLSKGERYLKRLMETYPEHSLVGPAWIALGKGYRQREEYLEAVEAFQKALRAPLTREERIEALYLLGSTFSTIGKHRKAVAILKQCLQEDPACHIRFPQVLESLGGSYFGLQEFAQSQKYLFWYLNLAPEAPGRDLVLARVAETFMKQGKAEQAKKLFWYVEDRYPDTEGEYIAKLRRAEYIEEETPELSDEASIIYEDLLRKDLSEPLRNLVRFRLAQWNWKQGRYEKSLRLVGETLQTHRDLPSSGEFKALQNKVIVGWAKDAFLQGDYAKTLNLYREYPSAFEFQTFEQVFLNGQVVTIQSRDIDFMIAESYENLKFYPNAMEIYEKILESDEENDLCRIKAAQCAHRMSKNEKALELCQAVSDCSCLKSKTELLARIRFKLGDYPKALEHFRERIQLSENPGALPLDLLLIFGECLVRTERFKEALPLLEKLEKRVPREDSAGRVALARLTATCLVQLGRAEDALKRLEDALNVADREDLRNPVLYELSEIYMKGGEKAKAEKALSRMLESSGELWRMAAQQRLNTLRMQESP